MKPLTLKFLVREWANFFFLIDNLAFPIDSMHREYNRDWFKDFGALSAEEEKAIQRYKSLWNSLGETGGGKLIRRFEVSFYQFYDSDPRKGKDLQKILEKTQLQELGAVFEAFQDRFQSMWKNYQPILSKDRLFLESEFSSIQQDFNESFSAIGRLYGSGESQEQLEIYLTMRPDPGFVGGRMLSQEPPKIMVESGVPDPQDRNQMSRLWLLLLHELTHACFENDKFFEFLYAYLDGRPPLSHFLEKYPATKTPTLATRRAVREMIINAVVLNSYVRGKFDQSYTGSPKDGEAILEGIRGKKLLKGAKTDKEKSSTILQMGTPSYRYIAWKLEKTVRPRLEEGREMDKKFLDGIYKVLGEFPDNLLKDLKSDGTGVNSYSES